MIRTQVYLPEDIYQQLKIEAKIDKIKTAEIIRVLLEKGLRESKKKRKSVGEALLDLAKLAQKGGPRDLSTNHDTYLYEE